MEHNDTPRRGHVGPRDFRGNREPGAESLPRLRDAPLDDAEPETCVPKSVTNRIDSGRQSGLSAHGTWSGRLVRNTKAATERQTGKGGAPQSGAKPSAVQSDSKGPNQSHSRERRPRVGLPLRADEEPAQPRCCDPRKHPAGDSKARARRKHDGEGRDRRLVPAAAGEIWRLATTARRYPKCRASLRRRLPLAKGPLATRRARQEELR